MGDDWVFVDPNNAGDTGEELVVSAASDPISGDEECSSYDSNEEDNYGTGLDVESPRKAKLTEIPGPFSGFFFHTPSNATAYAAFNRGREKFIPDPAFSFLPEPVAVVASNRGLVCARGRASGVYYVANPITCCWGSLPPPSKDHGAVGDAGVVLILEEPAAYNFDAHFHVVVAYPVCGGVYMFESFSSKAGEWRDSHDTCDAEQVLTSSGVGALGRAFWRNTMGTIVCYDPVWASWDLIPAPSSIRETQWWELGEMEGRLCVTRVANRVRSVEVLSLEMDHAQGMIWWERVGLFNGGELRNRKEVTVLRSQGASEVVIWDPIGLSVVAMDLEGHTICTIKRDDGLGYCADFIPYVSSTLKIPSNLLEYSATAAAEISTPARCDKSN